jgi:transglutaminase-like putative cysteine protease
MRFRGVLPLSAAVLFIAGCSAGPATSIPAAPASLGPSTPPSATGPMLNLRGTWQLKTGPDSTWAPAFDLLLTQNGNNVQLTNLTNSSYGEIVLNGAAFDATILPGYQVHGSVSADGRTLVGSAPDEGITTWRLEKESDDLIRIVRTSSFPATGLLRIPVGRSFLGKGSVAVSINGRPIDPALTPDGLGGEWTAIPLSSLSGSSRIEVRFTRQTEPVLLFPQGAADTQPFLIQTAAIDWGNPTIVSASRAAVRGKKTRIDKARALQDFVRSKVTYDEFPGAYGDSAAQTLARGSGMCINSSRLFVALARAAGIPSRSVWGVLYNGGTFDSGHEWAEFLDDAGLWHPLDFTVTGDFDLASIRFLGLVYDADENAGFESGINGPYAVGDGDVAIYSSFPMPGRDQYGFQMVEDGQDKKIVQNTYIVEAAGGRVRFVLERTIK